MRHLITAVLCTCFAVSAVARAQPLAERVPDDAMLYIGWAGADALGEAYKGSNLKGVLDNSRMRELFTQFIPQGFRKIIEHEPDAEQWQPRRPWAGSGCLRGLDTRAARRRRGCARLLEPAPAGANASGHTPPAGRAAPGAQGGVL